MSIRGIGNRAPGRGLISWCLPHWAGLKAPPGVEPSLFYAHSPTLIINSRIIIVVFGQV